MRALIVMPAEKNSASLQHVPGAVAAAGPAWLDTMISRRVRLDSWKSERQPDDVKTDIELAGS